MSLELEIECCGALPTLHAFTGNDYTSAFHGVGKVRAFKTMLKDDRFISTFNDIGESFIFDASSFPKVEQFVCALYSVKCKTVNEARYSKFCTNSRATEPQKLPPTRDALLCHCKRVAYVTSVIKRSLENNPTIPSPDGYGWHLEEGRLEIQWMLLPPAPEQVLQLISCGCKKSGCKTRACVCKSHGLPCTDLCHCISCENRKEHIDSPDDDDDDDDDNDDIDDDESSEDDDDDDDDESLDGE